MEFLVSGETSRLRSVIIGIADSLGSTPVLSELYDPKSIENLKKGNISFRIRYGQRIRKFCRCVEKI